MTKAQEPIKLTRKAKADVEMVTLFTLDDVDYQIPNAPKANIGLQYLRDLRTVGEQLAQANMLTVLLGEEGFSALCDYDDLTEEQLEEVATLAQSIVFGEVSISNSGK